MAQAYVWFSAVVGVFYALAFARRRAPWPLSDWLTNYEGGFVRRGLPGEVFLKIAHVLHVSVVSVVAAAQIVCVLCFAVSLAWLAQRVFVQPSTVWQKALLLSPATLAFFWFDPGLILRKEIALFAAMGLLLLLLRRRSGVPDVAITVLLAVCCPLLLLSHEGLVCYLPYLFALVAIGKKDSLRALKLCALPVVLCLLPFVAAVRHPGNGLTAELICRSIGGPSTGLCTGPIYYLGVSRALYEAEVQSLLHDARMMAAFVTTISLALLPVIVGFADLWRRPVSLRIRAVIPACFAVSVAASSVLFLEAQDWTRWIYIHMMCLLLVLFFAVEQRGQAESSAVRQPRSVAAQWTLAILLFVYATAWHLPEWILPGAREYKPFGYRSVLLRLHRHSGAEQR